MRQQTVLDAEFGRAEVGIYLSTAGVLDLAAALEQRASAADLVSRVRRARLLRSDALSRRGELEQALRLQVGVLTEAELDGDRRIAARAHFLLAWTYDRLAEAGKTLLAAEGAVKLLAPGDPPHWPAEHMLALAVCTSNWRHGSVDYTTFDEALRLARESGEAVLLLAAMNSYAFTTMTRGDHGRGGVELAKEMRRLVERELGDRCPSAWLDTIAVGLLQAGEFSEAAAVSAAAVQAAPRDMVEPSAVALCMLTQAKIERARGRLAGAYERALAAAALAREAGSSEAIGLTLEELSELAALEGNYHRAYEYLRERNRLLDRHQREASDRHAATLQAIYAVEVERQRRLALEALADTDPLTGLYNRRYMNRRLAELATGALVLALADLDHFKQVNDRFGHETGDRVLTELAAILRDRVQEVAGADAFVARIGGEEFLAVLPDQDPARGAACCEALRREVEGRDWEAIGREIGLTVSIGMAVQPAGPGDPSALLGRADAALYDAKRAGRNRVVMEDLA